MNLDWLVEEGRVEEGRDVPEAPPGIPARVTNAPPSVAGSPLRVGPELARGWTPLGPSSVWFGQASGRTPVSGRCRALAVSSDGQRAYAGTANGGLWYSSDAGRSWLPLDSFATTTDLSGRIRHASALSVGALHVSFGAAADASQDFVVVATGEDWGTERERSLSQLRGVGIRVATGPAKAVADNGVFHDPWSLEATNLSGETVLGLARTPDGVVWAATNIGLYQRPAANRSNWTEVMPGGSREVFSDVAVGAGAGAESHRLYAATYYGKLYVRPAGAAWSQVALPDTFPALTIGGNPVTRASLRRLRIATSPAAAVAHVLTRPDRLWRIAGTPPAAQIVVGVPPLLFGDPRAREHSGYNMAIEAAPDNADQLVLGGSYADQDAPLYPAALYRGTVQSVAGTQTLRDGTNPPLLVGSGVHADVHDVAWVAGGGGQRHVWVACDGGVYRSDHSGDAGSFAHCNDGLATLEPHYLAQHPALEGMLMIGTQDNGIVVAESPEVWRLASYGDGGGVAIDPADANHRVGQYTRASWKISQDGHTWSHIQWFRAPAGASAAVRNAYRAANEKEDEDASFYSACSAIVGTTGNTQLAIAARRVWYTDNWGSAGATSWRALPSLGDPNQLNSAGTGPRSGIDAFGADEEATVCRWAAVDTLHVLTTKRLLRFRRSGATWAQDLLYDKVATAARKAKNRSGQIPPDLPLTDVCIHDINRGTLGSVYVSTANPSPDDDAHHVWWFDGVDTWHDAGLDVDAPAYSVTVDAAHPEHVYVGTVVGVFRGTFSAPASVGAAPSWTWNRFSDGLPEAIVDDLQVHEGSRMLRAATAGRGVFELPIDAPGADPSDACYVRAFEGDLRHRTFALTGTVPLPRAGTSRPYAAADYTPIRWDQSPDIRVRRAPGSPDPIDPPAAFVQNDSRTADALWAQVALRAAGDAQVRVNGLDDRQGRLVAAVTRRTGNPTITRADWNALTRDAGTPNTIPFRDDASGQQASAAEANMLVLHESDTTGAASCKANTADLRIDVVLHSRAWREVDRTRLKVVVLRAAFAGRAASAATPPAPDLPANWASELTADVGRAPAARGAWLGTSGWHWVGVDHPMVEPPAGPHGRTAVVASLPAKLPAGDHLLLTVVLDSTAALNTALRAPYEVARQLHQAALRSVHVVAEPEVRELAFHEWHASQAPVAGTAGPSADDRRLVERRTAGKLGGKARLCLDFHERTVVGFKIELPAATGDWYASWEIRDALNTRVREHATFSNANYTAAGASGRLTNGHHVWLWEGRSGSAAGPFVGAGQYTSRLRVKQKDSGRSWTYETRIEVIGDPYAVHVIGRPKDDAALRASINAAGDPFSATGFRIARDCFITVHRGGNTAAHCVFLGQGTIEATKVQTNASAGAVATPHGTDFKGWIRVNPHGAAANADRIQLEDVGVTNGRIALTTTSGPAANNPYASPANSPWKDGVQAHAGNATRTTDGLSVGCTTVSPTAGTSAAPGVVWSGIHSHNTEFGTLNLTPGGGGVIPAFQNKQRKRTQPTDALLVDDTRTPLLVPFAADPQGEPLHLQPTLQRGALAGFRHAEIPFTGAVADAPVNQLRIRVRLEAYAQASLYALYHHAVFMAHDFTDDGTDIEVSVSVPRKVIRSWNGHHRNLLVASNRLRASWFVRRVRTGQPSTTVHRFVGTGDNDFSQVHGVGKTDHTWTPGALAQGQYYSVIRYRLKLRPSPAAANAWVAEAARADGLSGNGATIDAETIGGADADRYVQGECRLLLRTVP